MNETIIIMAILLPSKKRVKRTRYIGYTVKEGDWFNCVDPDNLEQKYKVVKIIGENYYLYPTEYESKPLNIF